MVACRCLWELDMAPDEPESTSVASHRFVAAGFIDAFQKDVQAQGHHYVPSPDIQSYPSVRTIRALSTQQQAAIAIEAVARQTSRVRRWGAASSSPEQAIFR
jgi:hypothetical protein